MATLLKRHAYYKGPIKAVILDWAGTTVDYGSLAPVIALTRIFEQFGILPETELIRASMGKHKREHLRDVLFSDPVRSQWQQTVGNEPSESDVDELFQKFRFTQLEVIKERAALIPGVMTVYSELKQKGLKIGSTTGYTREMMAVLIPLANEMGYQPDSVVCASDVPEGRPAPWMAITSAMEMGVYPMQAIVKVGDTPVDMAEGRNAGMWAVGVAMTGNEIGLDEEDVKAMASEELKLKLRIAYERLYQSGAHYVVDGIWDVPFVLDQIQQRLWQGESP